MNEEQRESDVGWCVVIIMVTVHSHRRIWTRDWILVRGGRRWLVKTRKWKWTKGEKEKEGKGETNQSTYIHHNYRFRSECIGFFYFWSSFPCMSNKIHWSCMSHIRSGMAYILDAFYLHNNHLDSYSNIFLRTKSVHFDMLYTAFPMNRCMLSTMNGTMHNCKWEIKRERI